MPSILKAPLYFNPVFFLTMAFVPMDQLYPEWVQCLAVFLLLGIVSTLLTLRNLRRGGEMV
jgi:RsiW-degrading membrane proteinase PrsW (M82 family)